MWAFLVVLGACTEVDRAADRQVLRPYLPDAEPMSSVPVFGGTMEPAPQLGGLVAADPQGNRVLRITGEYVLPIELGDNARPFRVHVEGQTAWVTLRGTGELAAIALDTANVDWRTRICVEPRGVARSPTGALVVACAGGELIEVSDDGEVLRLVVLDADLRDVVAAGGVLFVSRFAMAEVLVVDPWALDVTARTSVDFDATVAWRMRPYDDGVLVLHQVSISQSIELPTDDDGASVEEPQDPLSPYGEGGAETCGPIVEVAITELSGPTLTFELSRALRGVTVGTDFVMTPTGLLAVANAGAAHDGPGVSLFRLDASEERCIDPVLEQRLLTPGRPAAIAIDDHSGLIIQSAAPLSIAPTVGSKVLFAEASEPSSDVQQLFHSDPGVGVSCASCHPEGLDDGHVWTFNTETNTFEQLRRTMPLAGRILSRQPYHWDVAHPTPASLMEDTFVLRMGGEPPSTADTTALFEWLDGLRRVVAHPAAAEEQIEIGRTAFETAECATCHSGPTFTNNTVQTTDLDREPVKTPSLLGVGVRNRLLHDGRAYDLDARFVPSNRHRTEDDDLHGKVSLLTDDEIEALKAYLRTL